MKHYLFALATLAVWTSPELGAKAQHNHTDINTVVNDIPPRVQWDANDGYCGEVSLISAGLYYGQYISQYDARAAACGSAKQNQCQLLLGVNDLAAAKKLHLNIEQWDNEGEQSTDQFLVWVKQHVAQGNPVAIGIFTNEYLFYGMTDPDAGDPDYDHIVPIYAIGSNGNPHGPDYLGSDILYFSDNGLWGDPTHPPFTFNYAFDAFQATRQQANAPQGSIYSISGNGSNYGIAVTGVLDANGDTLPVRVSTNVNIEGPSIQDGSSERPQPTPLILTVTVSNLQPGVKYNLYRYNNLEVVPDAHFNANADKAFDSWEIQLSKGHSYTLNEHVYSDEVAVYRCVKATAP